MKTHHNGAKPKPTLKQLLAKVTKENLHPEIAPLWVTKYGKPGNVPETPN